MLDCATDVLPEQQSGVLPEQQSGVLPEQQSGVLPEQQSGVLPEQQSGVLPELVSATPWSIQHLRCGYDAANLGTKMVEEIISCCKKKCNIYANSWNECYFCYPFCCCGGWGVNGTVA